jgi:hypothetical protein
VWDTDYQCFHKRLCKHSLCILEVQHLFKQIYESSYFTFDAFQFSFDNEPLSDPFLYFPSFSRSNAVNLRWGNLCFNLGASMINVCACFYMMNSPFKGWHMVITFAWWNKNFDSCSNSTTKIPWVTVIVWPVSPEFKMIQKGLALMQNDV